MHRGAGGGSPFTLTQSVSYARGVPRASLHFTGFRAAWPPPPSATSATLLPKADGTGAPRCHCSWESQRCSEPQVGPPWGCLVVGTAGGRATASCGLRQGCCSPPHNVHAAKVETPCPAPAAVSQTVNWLVGAVLTMFYVCLFCFFY